MADKEYHFKDTNYLIQSLQNAEKSIAFIQREHASTLANLHEEVHKWQQKCSDLTFQLAISSTSTNSKDETKFRQTIVQLEQRLHQYTDTIKTLSKNLEEKESIIKDYDNRLIVNDRKHALELHTQHDKQREMKMELEQYSTSITQLTDQWNREKQHQQCMRSRMHLGQIILQNKPKKLKCNDEHQQQRQLPSGRCISKRSSSLSNQIASDQELTKVLFIGRRPPTPPQQLQQLSSKNIEMHDQPLYTKRQRPSLRHITENIDLDKHTSLQPAIKLSTVLPPIVNRKVPLKALTTITLQREGQA